MNENDLYLDALSVSFKDENDTSVIVLEAAIDLVRRYAESLRFVPSEGAVEALAFTLSPNQVELSDGYAKDVLKRLAKAGYTIAPLPAMSEAELERDAEIIANSDYSNVGLDVLRDDIKAVAKKYRGA